MSEEKLTTWTDKQLQEQLDKWTSQIEQGRIPDTIAIKTAPNFSRIELTLYTLVFDHQIIQLTSEQARHVHEWMEVYRFQIQLNRLEAISKGISNQNNPEES